jgi:hypothetical protein
MDEFIQIRVRPEDKEKLQSEADNMRLALATYCRVKLLSNKKTIEL